MSGGEHWASVDPSTNCTIECTIDCGCTTTSIRSRSYAVEQVRLQQLQTLVDQGGGVGGDHPAHVPGRMGERLGRASRRPSAPGCDRGTVPRWRSGSAGRPRRRDPPRRHWARAECSESTATSWPGDAARSTSGPPTTSDSLLASARIRPASRAAERRGQPGRTGDPVEHHVARAVGRLGRGVGAGDDPRQPYVAGRPAAPARLGVQGELQVLHGAGPADGDQPGPGLAVSAGPAARSAIPPAASPTTRNCSGCAAMTSSAWVPIDPVLPRMTTSRTRSVWHPAPPPTGTPRSLVVGSIRERRCPAAQHP